jgi:uncharacterized protein (TIGR01244 family)
MKQLDGRTMVAGQIAVEEVAELGRDGVTMIVNNRPDGEDAGQPTSAEMQAAADAAGLAYRHVPIARGIGPSDVEAMQAAMRDVGDGQMVAYCRSGMRSALAWALARRAEGDPRETIEAAAERAGIDLAPIAHLL